MPFLVLHSDNGSESIYDELRRFCEAHSIRFTCPRPWRGNDNRYLESKNWTLVRRCLGYHRFDTEDQLADFRQLEMLLAQRANVLQPSMALLEKIRTGAAGSRRETIPPDSPVQARASSRGQRSGKSTTPASPQKRRSSLPAARHRCPAGTVPREDQPECFPRSRERPDYFAMIPDDATTHTFTMILR